MLGGGVRLGGECVAPRGQHATGKSRRECVGLHAQVPKHHNILLLSPGVCVGLQYIAKLIERSRMNSNSPRLALKRSTANCTTNNHQALCLVNEEEENFHHFTLLILF